MARYLLPTFFLLGAGRCGTTSLARALDQHPEIHMARSKEPTFLASTFRVVTDPARYLEEFAVTDRVRASGDASHTYFSDPHSPGIIREFFPDARFVLILRDPTERALALYSLTRTLGYERFGTFERALEAEDVRFASERFRARCNGSFWDYMYVRSGLYGTLLSRYLEHFERDRFFITTLDELLADVPGTLNAIADHVGVAPFPELQLPHEAASRNVRSTHLQRLLRQYLDRYAPDGVDEPPKWHRPALNRLITFNTLPKPSIADQTRAMLDERFSRDLALLTRISGVSVQVRQPNRQ